jgi:hypothetical protein
MTKNVISEEIIHAIKEYLQERPFHELVGTYLYYVELKFELKPVLYPKEKMIFQSADDALKWVEKQGKLWHETEIKVGFSNQSVNELTKKIYICPFTGKIFGDNTHPNPQDAIYDWISKCPENKERIGGLPAKRFYISEDPEVIKSYLTKVKTKEPVVKVVYSSMLNGKLFNSKEAVIEDFKTNYLKNLTLAEVQSQDRFQIEEGFLTFIQKQLAEDKIGQFVETLAQIDELKPFVEQWLE